VHCRHWRQQQDIAVEIYTSLGNERTKSKQIGAVRRWDEAPKGLGNSRATVVTHVLMATSVVVIIQPVTMVPHRVAFDDKRWLLVAANRVVDLRHAVLILSAAGLDQWQITKPRARGFVKVVQIDPQTWRV
jgi:hypothetical protein